MRSLPIPTLSGLGVVNGVDLDQHVELVWRSAHAIARRSRGRVLASELLGSGWEGLRRAAERYDSAVGKPFENFASRRVIGAMQDYLRASDQTGRNERRRAKEQGREPVVSLNMTSLESSDGRRMEVRARAEPVAVDELARILFKPLKPRLGYIARRYWLDGLTMAQIGVELGCSEMYVCTLLKKARGLLMPRKRAEELVSR